MREVTWGEPSLLNTRTVFICDRYLARGEEKKKKKTDIFQSIAGYRFSFEANGFIFRKKKNGQRTVKCVDRNTYSL